jgi:hypothetical protein
MKPHLPLLFAVSAMLSAANAQSPAPVSSIPKNIPLRIHAKAQAGELALVANGQAADVHVDPADFKVVRIAADCFSNDVALVTGKKPGVKADAKSLSKQAVIIGTIGKSALVDALVKGGKLNAKAITGRWESFLITTVENPLPGVERALVIAGADRRGTAFGVFTVSEAMGVSPWNWWADVPVKHRDALSIGASQLVSGSPSVKYRGIFLNDEDWGLQPWAAKAFEPETKDIGPKTYARICELLLRLKANYLWPAMHPSTKAFNFYPENKQVADDYAIVMGSSHAEPMLRNNVDEWDKKTMGEWDYSKNRERVLKYWDDRVASNGKFENLYTIGMRGIHDSAMVGQQTVEERISAMEDIFKQQRSMLEKHVDPKATNVPQIFVPYKEVLDLYRKGLKVPDDVTLVWVDDNHGYVRQLSNPTERKRSGGGGVYYHLSYWGAPEDYLWIESTPPALVWEEMRKSYDNGARRVWVVNVGDIKPGEVGMDFFLRMAWDISPWKENAQQTFLTDWASRTFGDANAKDIAAVLDEYYRLNFPSKPEHLHLAKFTRNYGEIDERLKRFSTLVEKANVLSNALPAEQKDAFYELVLYRVRGAALANRMHLSGDFNEAMKAYEGIQEETVYYNDKVASGKWRHMLSSNPRNRPALKKPDAKKVAEAKAALEAQSSAQPGGYLSFEAEKPVRSKAPQGASWKVIPGLGVSGDSIALLPAKDASKEGVLEYDFELTKDADLKVIVYSLPTNPLHSEVGARYSVAIDGGKEQTFDIATAEYSKNWSQNVLRGSSIQTGSPVRMTKGKHTLKLRPLDPGLVFDKIVLDLGGLQPTHTGPPATPAKW